MSRHTVDARFLFCPMPVIRVQERIAQLRDGDELEAVCTDPGALYDIPAWCKIHGHAVLSSERTADGVRFLIKVCKTEVAT